MPLLQREGYHINFRWDGNPRGTPLVLSHSLGASMDMWEPQVTALGRHFHLLRYDHPGHGDSQPRPGHATLEDFGADVLALLDALRLQRVAFCGLSLGGMIGMWLGAHARDRLTRLVSSSAGARIADTTLLRGRIATIRLQGLGAITDSVLNGWFTPGFRDSNPQRVAWAKEMLLLTRAEAYAETAETVCETDLRGELARIRVPTLVLYGADDPSTPPAWNRAVQEGIKGATGK
ncbi:MAG TPA: alpha/beta fold hydrolase, partial [bacterium]|nr:alpha/beta fold hydrolase [bacterium]